MIISAFLPCRVGSTRISNKNTRPFAGINGGLVEIKLRQLSKIKTFEEIVLSTNDETAIKIAGGIPDPRIRIERRPKYLCESTTNIEELIMYVPTVIRSEHIFWAHATSPLADDKILTHAIEAYGQALADGYDSIMSVTEYKTFLWDADKRDFINFDRRKIKYPQTQDLNPLYEVNHAFYAASKKIYYECRDRIGKAPFLYRLSKIEAIDIDLEEDFLVAEQLYKRSEA